MFLEIGLELRNDSSIPPKEQRQNISVNQSCFHDLVSLKKLAGVDRGRR